MSFSEFVKDSPAFLMADLTVTEMEGSDFNFKYYEIKWKKSDTIPQRIINDTIWGISVQGVPYICTQRLIVDTPEKFIPAMRVEFANTDIPRDNIGKRRKITLSFCRIQTIGSICFFGTRELNQSSFSGGGVSYNPMGNYTSPKTSYNPATGESNFAPGGYSPGFGYSAPVKRKTAVDLGMKIMSLKTREILDFKPVNLLRFINDDFEVARQLNAAKKPENEMFRLLLQYNERHPFSVK